MGCLLSVSLVQDALKRLIREKNPEPDRERAGTVPPGRYKPFSVVSISRAASEQLGGFNEAYPFAFEDENIMMRRLESYPTYEAVDAPVPYGQIRIRPRRNC